MKHRKSTGLFSNHLPDILPVDFEGDTSLTINFRNNKPNQNITKTHEKK